MATTDWARAALTGGVARVGWVLAAVVLLMSCSDGDVSESGAEDEGAEVEHVELDAAPSEVHGQCAVAAETLGFDVPCPTLLPAGARSTCYVPSEPRPAPCVWGEGFFLEPVVTDLPGGYEGTESGSMHLVITASRDDGGCTLEDSKVEQVSVREQVARLYRCSQYEGLHAGHLVLSWIECGVVFGVSVHGHTDENRRLVFAIADSIDVVKPSTEPMTSSSVPVIALAAGRSSGRAQFEAADPKCYTQMITVVVKPSNVDVDLGFKTSGGSTLRVLAPERYRDCEADGEERVCRIAFPILEAQSPGTWTAIATKIQGPAATVDVEVLWERASASM